MGGMQGLLELVDFEHSIFIFSREIVHVHLEFAYALLELLHVSLDVVAVELSECALHPFGGVP